MNFKMSVATLHPDSNIPKRTRRTSFTMSHARPSVRVTRKATGYSIPEPMHHEGDRFCNPWASAKSPTTADTVRLVANDIFKNRSSFMLPKKEFCVPSNVKDEIPIVAPRMNFDVQREGKLLKATWLGHATVLLELPAPEGAARGARVLFDPILSEKCIPKKVPFLDRFVRFTDSPCKVEELKDIDFVIISHNHYDHFDVPTLRVIEERHSPVYIAGLGNERHFIEELGVPRTRIHTLDWWHAVTVTIDVPGRSNGTFAEAAFEVTCLPAQHQSGRSATDKNKALWCGFALTSTTTLSTMISSTLATAGSVSAIDDEQLIYGEEKKPTIQEYTAPEFDWSVYFSGDTGYRAVQEGQDEDEVPYCPAFKQIGAVFGGFDLAFLPIGSYSPRPYMSGIHCAPQDSVRLFKDIRARKAIAIHWGVFDLMCTENVLEPPKALRQAATKLGISADDFAVCKIGETTYVIPDDS